VSNLSTTANWTRKLAVVEGWLLWGGAHRGLNIFKKKKKKKLILGKKKIYM